MSADSSYAVGHGKPPLHTRFQKGQSGNPSGKPGPGKLARRRFQQALLAAMTEDSDVLKRWERGHNLQFMARRLARDALGGRLSALKFLLSELDGEIADGKPACDGANEAAEESAEESAAGPPVPDYARWMKANPDE